MSLKSCVHSTSRRRQFENLCFRFESEVRRPEASFSRLQLAGWCRHVMCVNLNLTAHGSCDDDEPTHTSENIRGFSFFSRRDLNTLTQSAMMQRDTVSNVVIGRWRTFALSDNDKQRFFSDSFQRFSNYPKTPAMGEISARVANDAYQTTRSSTIFDDGAQKRR